ncbi:hypothetical protein DFH07DRAFT_846199 [Mycena maculata]|uniref:Uncharacterized protein n=1 Tax=Mycena maculata TaxID=230809 RepID=A0AAD7I228_9AGAR|nr:hypothetical protein DFH07DRAFT_846199 [Mycena maculata]
MNGHLPWARLASVAGVGSSYTLPIFDIAANDVKGSQCNLSECPPWKTHFPEIAPALNKRDRDILGILVVLNAEHAGIIPVISCVLGCTGEDMNDALDRISPYVERHGAELALRANIRDLLEDPRRGRELIGYYHNMVAMWCLGLRGSKYPRLMLYAAERWEYHTTKSRRSSALYRALRDSPFPRRIQAYEYHWLQTVIAWLRRGAKNPEREAAIFELETHLNKVAQLLQKTDRPAGSPRLIHAARRLGVDIQVIVLIVVAAFLYLSTVKK